MFIVTLMVFNGGLHGELMYYGLLVAKNGTLQGYGLAGYSPRQRAFWHKLNGFAVKISSAPYFGAHNHYLCSVKQNNHLRI